MSDFKPLELNKENIDNIFQYCLANSYDDLSDVFEAPIFMGGSQEKKVSFSKRRLMKNKKNLLYLIGQLAMTHNPSALKMYKLDDLNKTYLNEAWTDNPLRLIALPHLTRYFGWSEPMININGDYYFHSRKQSFMPTLSPNDPMFDEWWMKNRNKWID